VIAALASRLETPGDAHADLLVLQRFGRRVECAAYIVQRCKLAPTLVRLLDSPHASLACDILKHLAYHRENLPEIGRAGAVACLIRHIATSTPENPASRALSIARKNVFVSEAVSGASEDDPMGLDAQDCLSCLANLAFDSSNRDEIARAQGVALLVRLVTAGLDTQPFAIQTHLAASLLNMLQRSEERFRAAVTLHERVARGHLARATHPRLDIVNDVYPELVTEISRSGGIEVWRLHALRVEVRFQLLQWRAAVVSCRFWS
jgi:hypothetical protein